MGKVLQGGHPGFSLVVDGIMMDAYLSPQGICIPSYTPTRGLSIDETKALIKVLEQTVKLAENSQDLHRL